MNIESNQPQPDEEPTLQDEPTQPSPVISPLPVEAAPQSEAQEPKKPRALSVRSMVLILVLAVLLIGGGSGLLYYTNVYRPAVLRSQATATARAQGTAQANASGTAQAISEATGIAQVNENNTATALADNQATATAVVLSRNLYLPNKGTWVGDPIAGVSPFTPPAGGITLNQNSVNAYKNLVYQVQMKIVSGNTAFGGLLFHYQANGSGLYFFMVNISGDYQFGTYSINTRNLNILQNGTSAAIKTGLSQTNTLAVVAQGSNFDFYINLQPVTSASDSTFTQGGVGAFSYNPSDAQAEVDIGTTSLWTL